MNSAIYARQTAALSILLVSTLSLSACFLNEPDDGGSVCTSLYAYGATVTVSDAATGALLSAATVTAQSQAGDEAPSFESRSDSEPGTWVGLGETTGEWTISAQATGYISQSRTITLESDGCHVIGQAVAFELERE